MRKTATKSGFTLVELMLVLSLTFVGLGWGIAGFSRSAKRQTVENAAARVTQLIQQARANAVSGNKDCGACGGWMGICGNGDEPLTGWQVVINLERKSVQSNGFCGATNFSQQPAEEIAPNSTQMTFTANPVTDVITMMFKPLNGGVEITGSPPIIVGPAGLVLTISDPTIGLTQTVRVRTSGEIE